MEKLNLKSTITNPNSIGDNLLQEIEDRGFGSLTKNDYEVFLFNELLNNGLSGKLNNEISLILRIPESKVKRLRHEADLRYGKDLENILNKKFLELLNSVQIKNNGKEIQFFVEDISVRKHLDYLLKKNGRMVSDSSFNSEVVKLAIDDYKFLLKNILNVDIDKEISVLSNFLIKNDKTTNLEGLLDYIMDISKDFLPPSVLRGGIRLTIDAIRLLINYIEKKKSLKDFSWEKITNKN
ncbi:MAG: hypothetical protein IK117_08135 [Bacteroidales bacterium]|nr:hypothetical protein [Bacteroidales bacterium]